MVIKKFDLYKEPYIRKADNKYYGSNVIMFDFLISLLPIILIGWYQNGIRVFMNNRSLISLIHPIIFVILGGLSCFIFEALYFYLTRKKEDKNIFELSLKSHSIIPGILLSLILPLNTPYWVLIIGCFITSIIAKMIFGGFGQNVFNPALVGYIFIMTAFYSVISNNNLHTDVVSSSTPLQEINDILSNKILIESISNNNVLKYLFKLKSGTLAETSIITCIISYVYLIIRKTINYKIPLLCIISFFISSLAIGLFLKSDTLAFAIYNLFNGGIIFGAIFMVTEPVTSPRSVIGKYIYSIFIGLLILILRLLSDLKDGTATAILFMNMLSSIIDNTGAKIRVENNVIKKLKTISIFIIIYILMYGYSIIKINTFKVIGNDNNITEDTKIDIINVKQDYSKLNEQTVEFIYTVIVDNKTYIINCDIDGNIKQDNNNYQDDDLKENIYREILKNKINKRSTNKNNHYGYIAEVDQINENEYIITSYARGYVNDVIIQIIYKDNQIIDTKIILDKEIELQGGLANSTGNVQDLINIGKGENSDIVSGVTYTSVSLFSARKAIIDYINNVLGGNNE